MLETVKRSDNEIYGMMEKNALDDTAQYADVDYDGAEPYVSVELTKHGVNIFDGMDAPVEREYTIHKPKIMTLAWLKKRIIATPSALALGVNIATVAEWVYENMPKYIYSTLNYLVFVGDGEEEDFDWLYGQNEFFGNALEEHDLPGEHQVGINWFTASTAVVAVGSIVKKTDEMVDDGELYDWEREGCINDGVATTVAHELRHIAQSNPYIPEEILGQHKNDEDDAEDFARAFVAAHPACLMRSVGSAVA